jgi:hypothetical protein
MAGRARGATATRQAFLKDAGPLAHQAAQPRGATIALDLGGDAALEGLDSTKKSISLAGGRTALAALLAAPPLPSHPRMDGDTAGESGQGDEEVIHGQSGDWREG